MTEPLLHRPQINPSPKAPRRERGPELVEPEVVLIELRPFCTRLQAVEKVQLMLLAASLFGWVFAGRLSLFV